MSDPLKFEPDDVYEAGARMGEVGVKLRYNVEKQLLSRNVPDLPPSLSGIPGELQAVAAQIRGDVSAILRVAQRMRNDAHDVGDVDVYYDMSLKDKMLVKAPTSASEAGDIIGKKLKSDADWWRAQKGAAGALGYVFAPLLDGTRDVGAGLEGTGELIGEVAAGNFDRPKALVKALRDDPIKFFQDVINWELMKKDPFEWAIRALPSVLLSAVSGGASSTGRLPKPKKVDVDGPRTVHMRDPAVTDVARGASTVGGGLLDEATGNMSQVGRAGVDARRSAIEARAALERQARLRAELNPDLDALSVEEAYVIRALKNIEARGQDTARVRMRVDELERQLTYIGMDQDKLRAQIAESWARTTNTKLPHQAAISAAKAVLPGAVVAVLDKALNAVESPQDKREVLKTFLLQVRLVLLRDAQVPGGQ
jgi:hypothetical protein